MKNIIQLAIALLLLTNTIIAQNIVGTVTNDKNEPLFGATIQWEEAEIGVIADENGYFELPKLGINANLLINYVGYNPMLVPVEAGLDTVNIVLEGLYDLMEVEVAAALMDNYVSTLDPINLETIGEGELRKAACCNLAESFSTNASVNLGQTDAVTGARTIEMLGLRGVYTQFNLENRPALSGLGTPHSMEFIPGTWLENIQVSKGSSTVQHGYQSIAGIINAELRKPFSDDPLFINLYGSTFGRGEINVHLNRELNDRWSIGTLLHHSRIQNSIDQNDDNFYDMPQKDQYNGMLRLFYRAPFWRAQFNLHGISHQVNGGQIANQIEDGVPVYEIDQLHRRVEAFGKIGYVGFDNPNTSIALIANASRHEVDARFGLRHHIGTQETVYTRLIFNKELANPNHRINLGASFLYDDFEERLDETNLDRTEEVSGVFGEYNFGRPTEGVGNSFLDRFGAIIGLRVDHHNMFGWLVSPRVNLKYNFSPESILRVSAGRGFRSANVVAENTSLLATGRQFDFLESLDVEEAWNFGINFTHRYEWQGKSGSLTLDLYRTDFVNQIVIDRQHVRESYLIYNLEGRSFANSALLMVQQEIHNGWELKLGYKYNDVQLDTKHDFHELILIPRHRGLIALGYKTTDEKWQIDLTSNLIGSMMFPENWQYRNELIAGHHEGRSPAYLLLGGQITRRFKQFDVYIGGENLANYRQPNPIIDAQNPFGQSFNAAQVYGPVAGAMGYVGLRFWLEKK